jgi:hypothetical protein
MKGFSQDHCLTDRTEFSWHSFREYCLTITSRTILVKATFGAEAMPRSNSVPPENRLLDSRSSVYLGCNLKNLSPLLSAERTIAGSRLEVE